MLRKEIFHSNNIEILRDFIELFPADQLTVNDHWSWAIDDMNALHLVQNGKHYAFNDIPGYLDIQFEGDGVVVFRLMSIVDDTVMVRALYDSHCLDEGRKFKRLFKSMNPDGFDFDQKFKAILTEYHDWYYNEEKDPTRTFETLDIF